MVRVVTFFSLLALAVGCTRVEVHKNPSANDKGIRYYRPKPYLFITPGGGGGSPPTFSVKQNAPLQVQSIGGQASTGPASTVQPVAFNQDTELRMEPMPEGVEAQPLADSADEAESIPCPPAVQTERPGEISIELVYMPDFSEEYSIQLKPGLGVGELSVDLEDGWNLTSVGMKTDQQTDEIIASTAQLLSSIGGIANPQAEAMGPGKRNMLGSKCEIYATNVPFGFYEAIIATDRCGRKQLFGWRYVGFMPFQCCPVQGCGMEQVHCQAECDKIFGLVWVNGILQFKHIADIPKEPVGPTKTPESGGGSGGSPPPATPSPVTVNCNCPPKSDATVQ